MLQVCSLGALICKTGVDAVPALKHKSLWKAKDGDQPGHVGAPRFALLVPPISVSVPILAALPTTVPVAAVPAPFLLVAAAAFAVPAVLTPSGLLTAAWNLSPGLACAFCSPNC